MTEYASVIVDISHENVDRAFEYIISEELSGKIRTGSLVRIPFGCSDRLINGYVTDIKDTCNYDEKKLKAIASVDEKAVTLESSLIELAYFIKTHYGSTMNRALKTVLPVKVKAAPSVTRFVYLDCTRVQADMALEKYSKNKRSASRLRLLKELLKERILPYDIVRQKLNISPAILKSMENEGIIKVDSRENLRKAFKLDIKKGYDIVLNEDQQYTARDIIKRYEAGDLRPSLIRGVTGSGKTEVYIELIDSMLKKGRQAIVLIPEIALTYQTVLRFYKKFGDRISVINSKLSYAQRHDQLERARRGEVDIIIGPRSALFAPFNNIGIIVIDEEHEGTYKNENTPRYHSREVAIKRAQMSGGIVVMGSATPSVESYNKALTGDYELYELERRAKGANLPESEIVDLRRELNEGNRSIISRRLDELIRDRLEKKEQIILFLNRRGYSSFVSCRNCGEAIKCPHCDVSLKYHKNGRLICHYCGYEEPMVKTCPKCGSKYIGTFGTGTQKAEEELMRLYPDAVVLRMDHDTTKNKEGHEKILSAFANHEADILIGTQMIVKGHDFSDVTLVGILAADMSLYMGDYAASERTFELLTQASGRAGRSSKKGHVIIQTYSPENYAIQYGAAQDYKGFFETEMNYRSLLGYPPAMNMLGMLFTCEDEKKLNDKCTELNVIIDGALGTDITKIGPSDAPVAKINDQYRKIIYLKSKYYDELIRMKDLIEKNMEENPEKNFFVSFDFSMIGS